MGQAGLLIKMTYLSRRVSQFRKFNPNHDDQGRFAAGAGGHDAGTLGVQGPESLVAGITAEDTNLPKMAKQPIHPDEKQKLVSMAWKGLDELKQWLDQQNGLLSKNGFRVMDISPDHLTPEDLSKPGGMVFLREDGKGNIKVLDDPTKSNGWGRGTQKVMTDYNGDWSLLRDIVRTTVVVDNISHLKQIYELMKAHGMVLAQMPKNKFSTPSDVGYRDLNVVAKLPSGVLAEIQFHTKEMLKAKAEGHPYYETQRELKAKYGIKGWDEPDISSWSHDDQGKYEAAIHKQKEIYGSHWQKELDAYRSTHD